MVYAHVAAPTSPQGSVFRVVKKLGEGSYAEVFQVIREVDGRTYALKETDLSSLSQQERMDAVQEIKLMATIQHPQIVGCHEAFLKGNKLCTVMELASSGDLKNCIRRQREDLRVPFPEEMVWNVTLQVARGLSALHAKNVIHRDVKPANIFLCDHKFIKIGDLGVAKRLMHDLFTQTQIGTPAYMAPEVWAKAKYSYSSDMYSLGCILYEMMTYKLPYLARSMEEMRKLVTGGKLTPISPGVYSADIIQLCHSLLSLDVRKRPTPDQILNSQAAVRWMYTLPNIHGDQRARLASRAEVQRAEGQRAMAASTDMPKELRHLPKLLPVASYETDGPEPGGETADAPPRDVGMRRDQNRGQAPMRGAGASMPPGSRLLTNTPTAGMLPSLDKSRTRSLGGKPRPGAQTVPPDMPPPGGPGAGVPDMFHSLSPVAAAAAGRVPWFSSAARSGPPRRNPVLAGRGPPGASALSGRRNAVGRTNPGLPPARDPRRASEGTMPRAGLMSGNAQPGGFSSHRPWQPQPAYGIVPGLAPPSESRRKSLSYTGLVSPWDRTGRGRTNRLAP